jgi:hypothetical protein
LGGFAVDADFGDGLSGSTEHPKFETKRYNPKNFTLSPGGGSGPKHSAFCGACFSINPYSSLFGLIKSKIDKKNTEPSTFFNPHFGENLTTFDPHKLILKL